MPELWEILDIHGNPTGRLHERGTPLRTGEYHLSVNVWIENGNGEFLISRRSPNKSHPHMWECTGGNAVAGDDSLTTALKEVREELGVVLEPRNGRMIRHRLRKCICGQCLSDVWHFRQDVDIANVTLAPDETCGAMWASRDAIDRMIGEGTFATWGLFANMDALFGGE